MSYKITIIDNDDGKVLVDESEAIAIIGACSNNEETAQVGFAKCNAIILAQALDAAHEAIEKIESKSPHLTILRKMKEMLDTIKKEDSEK